MIMPDQSDEPLSSDRIIAAETRIRNTFQSRWPAQLALAWIITRSENAVDQIDDLRTLWQRPSWNVLLEMANTYKSNGQSREQGLWDAFNRLKAVLESGKIVAWRSRPPYVSIETVDSEAFAKAGLTVGALSCGLFGVSFTGTANDFVLMRTADVMEAFPAAPSSSLSHIPALAEANGAPTPSRRPKPWSADAMTTAIAEYCDRTMSGNADAAWKNHFKELEAITGWSNTDFRNHWSTARGTKGKAGRQSSAANLSADKSA